MKIKFPKLCCLLVSLLAISSSGCAIWKKPSSDKPSSEKSVWSPSTWFKKEFQEPVSMATIWRADRMAEPGHVDMRGFGARVYFYNDKSQPIPVEGELTVHGYVTTPSSRKDVKEQPDRKFNYSSEQLSSQYSPSDMGASYSVWVPWDEDGFREEITLIATFKSKKGSVVQASPTKILLPGKSPVPNESLPPTTQQVSYKKTPNQTYDLGPAPEKLPSTRITTIELPQKSRLNQPNLGLPVQTNTLPSDGQAIEVGGGSQTGLSNSGNSNLQMLPPPLGSNQLYQPSVSTNTNVGQFGPTFGMPQTNTSVQTAFGQQPVQTANGQQPAYSPASYSQTTFNPQSSNLQSFNPQSFNQPVVGQPVHAQPGFVQPNFNQTNTMTQAMPQNFNGSLNTGMPTYTGQTQNPMQVRQPGW